MLYVVGLGPGKENLMTQEALQIIEKVPTIVTYATYAKLISGLIKDKNLVVTGMHGEIERCKRAIEIAANGEDVAIVSSGDAGIYGMAGLVLELANKSDQKIDIQIIPGVTASIAAAAHLGAPLMNDFCHISLSDLMTPWKVITKRLAAAAAADFVICLYNPRSKGRSHRLSQALDIILKYKSPATVVGVGKDVARSNEKNYLTTLKSLDDTKIDMTSIVIIGNKNTYVKNGEMITPRGYVL